MQYFRLRQFGIMSNHPVGIAAEAVNFESGYIIFKVNGDVVFSTNLPNMSVVAIDKSEYDGIKDIVVKNQ